MRWPQSGIPYWVTAFWVVLPGCCVLGEICRGIF
jgi:hypothetical protein